MPGNITDEILHHSRYAKNKLSTFIGRSKLIEKALTIILKPNDDIGIKSKNACTNVFNHIFYGGIDKIPNSIDGNYSHVTSRLSGVSLCIIGKSGSGKSSLMAAIAHKLREFEKSRRVKFGAIPRPVIIRFCHTSKGSVVVYLLYFSCVIFMHTFFHA